MPAERLGDGAPLPVGEEREVILWDLGGQSEYRLVHQLFLQDVQMGVAGMLLVGSVPGVLIGSRMSVWVPRRPLQIGLAGLLLTSAWSLLR